MKRKHKLYSTRGGGNGKWKLRGTQWSFVFGREGNEKTRKKENIYMFQRALDNEFF